MSGKGYINALSKTNVQTVITYVCAFTNFVAGQDAVVRDPVVNAAQAEIDDDLDESWED